MPAEERHETTAPAVPPPPPTATLFFCRVTARGREVEGRRTAFLVTPDALVVTWETGWTGKQRRSIKRRDVRAVRVLPDRTSSLSRHMTQLVIELADGQTLAPLRRSPAPETTWLADRLREALRPEEPEWGKNGGGAARVVAAEADVELPAAPPRRQAARVTGVVNVPRVARARAPRRDAAPPPVASIRAGWRRGRVFVRARRVSPFSVHRQLFALIAIFVVMAFGMNLHPLTWLGSRLAGARVATPPAWIFFTPFVGLALLATVAWVAWEIYSLSRTRYVFLLSRRWLRVAKVSWPSGRRKTERRVPRADVADVLAGVANEKDPPPELHVHLWDGSRLGFMAGRPRRELQWIAWNLAQALPRLTADAPPAWTAGGADVPADVARVPILPYARETKPTDVSIHEFPDGGVVVTIPPAPLEKWGRLVPYWVGLVLLALATGILYRGAASRGLDGPLLLLAAAAAALVAPRAAVAALRHGQPLVVGVDAAVLYADDPNRLRRRRQWPRHTIADVRLTTEQRGTVRIGRYAEVRFTDRQPPLRLCEHRGDWDRKRLAAVLRKAAGLPGPPPEHVLRTNAEAIAAAAGRTG
ncbi:MAG TPA: hypothetical protein VFB66_07725 [Tepidisphaeraceae bacterium]|nr:hypothetical protein [Tepidisphaeraceae bacterium]